MHPTDSKLRSKHQIRAALFFAAKVALTHLEVFEKVLENIQGSLDRTVNYNQANLLRRIKQESSLDSKFRRLDERSSDNPEVNIHKMKQQDGLKIVNWSVRATTHNFCYSSR